MCSEEKFCVIFVRQRHSFFFLTRQKKIFCSTVLCNFLKIFFVSEPTQISTPFFVRGGGGFFTLVVPGKGRSRTKRKRRRRRRRRRDDDARARERFLSRAVSPSTPRSAKTLESATLCAVDNERRRTNESIPRTFFVFNKTTLTRRKEENGAGRGVSSSSSRKRARDPSLSLSRSWNRVRKTALLVPSPSIDGVAECGVLCFVSRFLFC